MIAEFGLLCLCLLPPLALLSLLAARLENTRALALQAPLQHAMFMLSVLAFFSLMACYIRSDFSVAVVAQNSTLAKPMLYKITGTWGNHEGSMLLWLLVLTGYGAAFLWRDRNLSITPTLIAIQNLLVLGITGFVLLTSNPFLRIYPAPADGSGMNPVLQDIGLAIHPPTLYLGYVGYSLVYSLSIAALLQGRLDKAHIAALRRWALIAWSWLTLGIGLGAWWAYRELGWGGWWFWDPVENASLMPWLLGVALLHSLKALEKRKQFPRAALWMGISCFILSVLGTFLVRSGVLTSVHSFALDPERGLYIIGYLSLLAIGGYSLWGMKNVSLTGPAPAPWQWLSRDTTMLVQNLLLITACATVTLGTLYPLIMQALGTAGITVGHPYFNSIFLPLSLIAGPLAVIAPLIAWREDKLPRLKKDLLRHLALGIAALGIALLITQDMAALLLIGTGIWLLLASIAYGMKSRKQGTFSWPLLLGHAGFACLLIGVAGTTLLRHEGEYMLKPGQSAIMGPYRFTYRQYDSRDGQDYREMAMHLSVSKNDNPIGELVPTKRLYTIQGMPTSESATMFNSMGDLYAAVGDVHENGEAGFRFYYKPGIQLVWLGFVLMAAGGITAARRKQK
ncbi:heme lyase NrfEFG subunit NrfE [bacterium]|nr:heme lyase NrfEFG subunit NrfE [bacterium]